MIMACTHHLIKPHSERNALTGIDPHLWGEKAFTPVMHAKACQILTMETGHRQHHLSITGRLNLWNKRACGTRSSKGRKTVTKRVTPRYFGKSNFSLPSKKKRQASNPSNSIKRRVPLHVLFFQAQLLLLKQENHLFSWNKY